MTDKILAPFKKAVVYSLGCKVNQYEGQAMIARLKENGIESTDALEKADFYILNTCSVTSEADRKSRQSVARVLKLNPEAIVYICGCSSQNDGTAFENKQNVRFISGTGSKIALIDRIMRDIIPGNGGYKAENLVTETPIAYEDNLHPEHTRTRGFMKIQDGCNNFCSYCIVPYLRGRSRSRSPESVLSEAQLLAETTEEIVLSGINLSDYGRNVGSDLTQLVRLLKDVPVRKRLGSLECGVIDEPFLSAMQDGNFCDHFHLSLQSGSDSVLKRMNRHYNTAFFLQKVELIRKYFPNAGITTDIIAGFPEETEREHLETLEFVQKVRFSDIHVFPYSERKGTKASVMNQVPKAVRVARAAALGKIKERLKAEFFASQQNRVLDVYVEETVNHLNTGYTANYIKVYTSAPLNSFLPLRLTAPFADGMKGEQ